MSLLGGYKATKPGDPPPPDREWQVLKDGIYGERRARVMGHLGMISGIAVRKLQALIDSSQGKVLSTVLISPLDN